MLKKLCFILILFGIKSVSAQDVSIQLGQNKIGKNQYFTISAISKNGNIKSCSDFPNIRGLNKANINSSSSTNIINGRMSSVHKYVQNYIPTKEGTFKLTPFQMKINGKIAKSNGTTIKIGPPIQQQRYDPFADFFGRRRNQQPQEFVEVEDDAFFAISTDKNEIYEGEGYTVTVAFYVSNQNKAPMDFYALDKQIPKIEKLIQPENSWEEKTEIVDSRPTIVTINGKNYKKFTFYQSTYYPLNAKDIIIKPFGLKMIKYKVAKQRSFFGNNTQQDFKTYYSKAKKIKVKQLPEHPMKNMVAVGNYKLKDAISTAKFETGQSFNYQFKIRGEGNINAIKPPKIFESSYLEVYPPNEHQDINKNDGRVYGSKTFDYYIIPTEPGEVDFTKQFQWIFFNTKTAKYDTLHPDFSINIEGESTKNSAILSNDIGIFYDRIDSESNDNIMLKTNSLFYLVVQSIMGIFGVISLILIFIKFKK